MMPINSSIDRIDYLTDEQKAKLKEYADKWIKIALCTEPADRKNAELAINKVYQCGGLSPPKAVIWNDSPLSQAIVIALLGNKEWMDNIGWENPKQSNDDDLILFQSDNVSRVIWDTTIPTSKLVECFKKNSKNIKGIDEFISIAKDTLYKSIYGNHSSSYLSFYNYMREVLNLVKQTDALVGLMDFALYAGWAVPYKDVCFISERHNVVKFDDENRIHCEDGPAISYPDGFSIYALYGERVPEHFVMEPEKITLKDINDFYLSNKVHNHLINKYGKERYIDAGGKVN